MKRAPKTLFKYVVVAAAALYIAPIAFMVVGSFKPDANVLAEAGSWKAFSAGRADHTRTTAMSSSG